MPRPNVPLGIQANTGRNQGSPIGDTGEIDLLGIISRMLAGEDEADPNVQQAAAGIADVPVSLGAASGGIDANANIPMIQADPTPVKVRPPGFVEDPRNVSTFPPSQEVPVDVNEPAPFAEELLQQQQQASLQDYNPDVERVSGVPRLPVSSEVLSPPGQSNRELEQALFDIIMRSGNV